MKLILILGLSLYPYLLIGKEDNREKEESIIFNEKSSIYCADEDMSIGNIKVVCSECYKLEKLTKNECLFTPLKIKDNILYK